MAEQLTPEQYISKLTCFSLAITDYATFGRAVQSVHALRCERIFVKGQNSNETSIGSYNTTDGLYINPDKAPRKTKNKAKGIAGLQPIGKTGKTVFASTGKPHKTAYVTSYADLKNKIGQSSSVVNLVLFGDLQSNLSSGSRGDFKTQAVKVSPSEYIVGLDSENSLKKSGLEEHFGGTPIFTHSKNELQKYQEIIKDELLNTLSKCK